MGSTSKMGAGTNVQDKLIALHHLDCAWKPSDLTQRNGRMIRQGNENEKVFVYSYVTEKTFDAYMYQLVEQKQKFISQIMTSKTPARTMEDIDEKALSYGEIKALATVPATQSALPCWSRWDSSATLSNTMNCAARIRCIRQPMRLQMR